MIFIDPVSDVYLSSFFMLNLRRIFCFYFLRIELFIKGKSQSEFGHNSPDRMDCLEILLKPCLLGTKSGVVRNDNFDEICTLNAER